MINESLGFLINRLATAMRRSFEERLTEFDITAPQFGFLASLYEEDGQPLSNIGKCVYCDKPTITGIANRLEKKGLIKKIKDEKDRRIIKAVLTEKGKKLRDPLFKTALTLNADVVEGFNDDETATLKALVRSGLDNLLRNIEGGIINV